MESVFVILPGAQRDAGIKKQNVVDFEQRQRPVKNLVAGLFLALLVSIR